MSKAEEDITVPRRYRVGDVVAPKGEIFSARLRTPLGRDQAALYLEAVKVEDEKSRMRVKWVRLTRPQAIGCLKVFSMSTGQDFPPVEIGSRLDLIEREVASYAAMEHPFVLTLIGTRKLDSGFWICTEIYFKSIPGIIFEETDFRVKALLAIHLYTPILTALKVIHGMGYVHRNIGYDSLLFAVSGVPKLGGFDKLVKIGSLEYERSRDLKEAFVVPYVSAPEVALLQTYDGRADIFSLAVYIAVDYSCKSESMIYRSKPWETVLSYYRKGDQHSLELIHSYFEQTLRMSQDEERAEPTWENVEQLYLRMSAVHAEDRPTAEECLTNTELNSVSNEWAAFLDQRARDVSDRFMTLQCLLASTCKGQATKEFSEFVKQKRLDSDRLSYN